MNLTCIKDIAQIAFYIASSSIAFWALFTWRREMHGRSKYSIAKDVLAICIRIESAFSIAQTRSIFLSSSNNIIKTYEPLTKFAYELSQVYVNVRVLWGEKGSKLIHDLINKIYEVDFIASSYEPSLEPRKEELSKKAKYILDGKNEEFNQDVKKIIKSIEEFFGKFVRK